MVWFFIAFTIVFLIVAVSLITYAIRKEKDIYTNGIEVDGEVIKMEKRIADHSCRYDNYVKYIGDDNIYHEGILNYSGEMAIGRKVRIKFKPGKYDYVVFVSQTLD